VTSRLGDLDCKNGGFDQTEGGVVYSVYSFWVVRSNPTSVWGGRFTEKN
jgi:hypothetical protein